MDSTFELGSYSLSVLINADSAAGELLSHFILADECEADSVHGGADNYFHIVNDKRSVDGTDRDFLPFSNSHL